MPQRNSLRYTAVAWQNTISVKELVTVTRAEEKKTVWIPRKFRIFSQLPSVSLTFSSYLAKFKAFRQILKKYDGSLSFYGLSLSKILIFFFFASICQICHFLLHRYIPRSRVKQKSISQTIQLPLPLLYLHEHHYNCILTKLPFV